MFLGNNQQIGNIAPALTDNIHLATTFNEGYPPFEMAEKYGKLLGVNFTPMKMIPQGVGIFPKYELMKMAAEPAEKPTFQARDYIVTRDGHRGFVVRRLDRGDMYEIRTAGGYTMRHADDLKLDELMMEEAL